MANTDDIATPLLNIIVLTPEEEIITWLIPDITEIKEINEKDKVRKIEITYPVDDKKIYDEERPWFSQGNKIFIPAIFGMTNCLYIINTDYDIDYWDKNYVTVQAEEILTELNNQMIGVYSKNSIKITKDKLIEWFGRWYTIDKVESLNSTKNSIQQLGTTTLMTLLRTIEEKTERVFYTEYSYKNNIITRKLSLVKEDTLRQTAGTEYLDLNYNLDNLELNVSEEKTFNAMAPELSINQQTGTNSADYINANDSRTNNAVVQNTLTAEEIYQSWLDLEVEYREEIPMIQEKQADGRVVTTQKWYAPFAKSKGELYIENTKWTDSKYNHLQPPANPSVSTKDKIPNPLPKCGTVSTSETDPYAIYNVLANSLLDKLNPKFELKIKVSDITQILGVKNLGYNLYETLYVRVPGFDYWIPAYITKTTKNPHEPGNDTITVETDVRGTHNRQDTIIKLDNAIIAKGSTNTEYGGVLVDTEGKPIANALVTVNVKLKEAYMTLPTVTTITTGFDPRNNTYYFSKDEILILEKSLRSAATKGDIILYDIRGKNYSIPWDWCLAIYYTYIQQYINTDVPYGAGKFPDSVAVHYYENATEKLKTDNEIWYYPSFYIEYMEKKRQFYKDNNISHDSLWSKISSSEIQGGPFCVANAIANACAYVFMYHTEQEIVRLMGSVIPNTANFDTLVMPLLKKLGFATQTVSCTKDNIKKYVAGAACALVAVSVDVLGYEVEAGSENDLHEIMIYDWYQIAGQKMKIIIADSNRGYTNPASANQFNIHSPERDADTIINAIGITQINGKIQGRSRGQTPCMVIVEPTEQQKAEVPERRTNQVLPNNTNNGEDYPNLITISFSIEGLRTTFKTAFKDTGNIWTKTFKIVDSTGVTRNINICHVLSLGLTYMARFYNIGIVTPLQEANINTGSDAISTRFFKIVNNEQALFSTVQVVKVLDVNINKYILSWILFNIGYLVPPQKTFGYDSRLNNYSPNSILSAANWTSILKLYDSDVKTKLVDFTESNINQYSGNIMFIYLDSNYVQGLGTPTINASSYPAFLIKENNNILDLFIPHLAGEVPEGVISGNRQSNSGYYTTPKFNEIQLSNSITEFKGKALVITNLGDL